MRKMTALSLASLLALGVVGSIGCRDDGPAEEAGEQIDRTVDKMKDKAEDAVD